MKCAPFIAVHLGAGNHSVSKEKEYSRLCSRALTLGMQTLLSSDLANPGLEALITAVSLLEDSPLTNAGIGSNLNMNGEVECDASLMSGVDLRWRAVSCIKRIKNPIQVTSKMLQFRQHMLQPPCILVSSSAEEWAHSQGIPLTDPTHLLTKSSIKTYNSNLKKLKNFDNLGTVGCICRDPLGNVFSAVSSGGSSLKLPGRLGSASHYGSGCWAVNSSFQRFESAISVSGCGEDLIKTLFAKSCSDYLLSNDNCTQALMSYVESILKNPFLETSPSTLPQFGFISLSHDSEFSWAYTTSSFCLGYKHGSVDSPSNTFISRKKKEALYDVQGVKFC